MNLNPILGTDNPVVPFPGGSSASLDTRRQSHVHAPTQTQSWLRSSNSSYSYSDLLNRIATDNCCNTFLPQSLAHINNHHNDRVLSLLLEQPPEIRNCVLRWLHPNDLLNLRAVNHTYHNWIHDGERDIVLSLADRIPKALHFPYFHVCTSDLSSFFQRHKNYTAACAAASVAAARISRRLYIWDIRKDDQRRAAYSARKLPLLEPSLQRVFIVIQEYLNFMLDTIVANEENFASLDDDEYTSLQNIFDLDQQAWIAEHFRPLTEKSFQAITCAFQIIRLMSKARGIPFSMKSPAHPFCSVRQILIHKGLKPFAKLWREDTTPSQQLVLIRKLSTEIGNMRRSHAAGPWSSRTGPFAMRSLLYDQAIPTIYHLRGFWTKVTQRFDQKRSTPTRAEFLHNQDLWDRNARARAMQELGWFPRTESVTTWIRLQCEEDGEQCLDHKGVIVRHYDIQVGPWDTPDGR